MLTGVHCENLIPLQILVQILTGCRIAILRLWTSFPKCTIKDISYSRIIIGILSQIFQQKEIQLKFIVNATRISE